MKANMQFALPVSIEIAAQTVVQRGPVQVQTSSEVEPSIQMKNRFYMCW